MTRLSLSHGVAMTAVICLGLGATGGAVAGGLVTSAQIKNDTITTKDVKNKTLTSKDISRKTLTALAPPAVVPSGTTVRGTWLLSSGYPGNGAAIDIGVSLPIPAPVPITKANVLIDGSAEGTNLCRGTLSAPTAPRGKVCVYALANETWSTVEPSKDYSLPDNRFGFGIAIQGSGTYANVDAGGTWAYTAP